MSSTQQSAGSSASEQGSAIAEFVFTSALIALLCAGIFQLAFALHVRNTLIDCAGEGARHAALQDSSLEDGIQHTQHLISGALPLAYGENVSATVVDVDGVAVVEVRVQAPLPLLGFLGPQVVSATGRAFLE